MYKSPICCTYLLALATLLSGTNVAAQGATKPSTDTASAAAAKMATSATAGTDTAVMVVDVTPDQGPELRSLLKREIAKAVALGRTPFVELGATWCGGCEVLKAKLGDPRMIQAFAGTYIIRLDLDAWQTQLKSLGLKDDLVAAFFTVDTTGQATKRFVPHFRYGEGDDVPAQVAPKLERFFQAHLWKAP